MAIRHVHGASVALHVDPHLLTHEGDGVLNSRWLDMPYEREEGKDFFLLNKQRWLFWIKPC